MDDREQALLQGGHKQGYVPTGNFSIMSGDGSRRGEGDDG